MKVGLFFDLRNPHQWRRDPVRLHAFTLELIEEAEHLGIDSVWTTEHHLFADDYLAAPLTFLAGAATRTSRARLGTAIVIAPLHHAAEIAEQSALVDLLSGGRLDLGLGAGYRVPEYQLFGADISRRYGQTDERARQVRALLAPGGVRPAPAQAELPIWMGYQGPQGAHRAGMLGERLLNADARSWPPYRDGLLEAGHDLARARMSGSVNAWVTDDPDRDWQTVRTHLSYQLDSYNSHWVEGTGRPVPRPVDPEHIRGGSPRLLNYFWCDSADVVAANIKRFVAGAPVETVFLYATLPGMPAEMALQHTQTVCTKLVPLLAAYDPQAGSLSASDEA